MAGEGASALHPGNFRSRALLDLAAECPYCMACGSIMPLVAAHSNAQKHGKGKGLKAHDIPAYLCSECHEYVDGPGPREERAAYWADAMLNSMVWLLQAGKLKVTP